ncbi:unnamed protein product, partial [Closterium sp. NIES-54]
AAHVAAALITVQSQHLELPLYANSPQAYYVLKGEAMAGLISPMGAPTNLRRLRKGDAFAIPRGRARWIWNNGKQPFQVLSVADTSNSKDPHAAGTGTSEAAPSDAGRYTAFHLMGAQEEEFGSILHGFSSQPCLHPATSLPPPSFLPILPPSSSDLLAQAWDVEEGEVQQLLQAQQESVFVKAYGGNDQPHVGKGAKRSESIFAVFTYNLKTRQPDIYVKRGGTVTAANGYKLPAFRKVGFAVARFSLEGNAVTAPRWLANAAAMLYVTKGKGREEIAYPDGRQALQHDVKEGDFVVVPASFPHAALTYGEGLECIAMIPKSRPQAGFLAGSNSVFRMLPASVQRAAFNTDEKLLEKLRATRQSELASCRPGRARERRRKGRRCLCSLSRWWASEWLRLLVWV